MNHTEDSIVSYVITGTNFWYDSTKAIVHTYIYAARYIGHAYNYLFYSEFYDTQALNILFQGNFMFGLNWIGQHHQYQYLVQQVLRNIRHPPNTHRNCKIPYLLPSTRTRYLQVAVILLKLTF